MSSFSWLRGVVRATLKQEDQEDDDVCIIVFLVEKSCEDILARRKPGRRRCVLSLSSWLRVVRTTKQK
jgi:hypothetical protein